MNGRTIRCSSDPIRAPDHFIDMASAAFVGGKVRRSEYNSLRLATVALLGHKAAPGRITWPAVRVRMKRARDRPLPLERRGRQACPSADVLAHWRGHLIRERALLLLEVLERVIRACVSIRVQRSSKH